MLPRRLSQTLIRRTYLRAWLHACMLAALLAGLLPPPLITALVPTNALAAQATRLLPAPQTAQAAAQPDQSLSTGQPDVALRGDLERQASQSVQVESAFAAQAVAPLTQASTLGFGDLVWKDANANGLQDNGEAGIAGVKLDLYDNSGNPVLCLQQTVANLALNKAATASSNYGGSYPAGNAVDGNLGNMAITNADVNGWWQVDLGQSAKLQQVVIFPRPDGYHPQTEQIYVEVANQPFASTNLATTLADPNVWSSALINTWSGASFTVTVPSYAGRYVRIQHSNNAYLALGEVQVLGNAIGPVSTFTDANGFYSFTSADCVQPNTTYALRIDRLQPPLFGLGLTTLHAGNVISDSDAVSQTFNNVPYAVITATAPVAGIDTRYDAGFAVIGIGNTIWRDSNTNGQQDANEPGIANVTVSLYNPNGTPVQCVQTQGRYYLDNGGSATDSAGDLNWSGQAWTFSSAGVTSGGNPGNTVYIYGNGAATRAVNLSVFGEYPHIAYNFAYSNGTTGYSHVVEYSTDGGVTWTTLNTYSATGATGWDYHDFTLPTLSATARIRIRGTAGTTANYLRIDNLRIWGGIKTDATSVTDSDGNYSFDGRCVQPNTAYQVRVDRQQAAQRGLYLTTPNAGGVTNNNPTGDDSDSDATATTISNTLYAVINLTSLAAGVNNSYDLGFVENGIGNFVWKDNNTNGLQDSSEPGISDVVVSLYNPNGTPVQCVQNQTSYYLDTGASATDSAGDLNWSGQPWTFSSASVTGGGNPGNTVYVYGNGTATRAVDLSVFGAYPTLSYDFAYVNTTTGYNHVVEYSTDGGTTWTTLATYVAGDSTTYQSASFILPSLSANVRIRIRGTVGATGNYLRIDNVRIEGGVATPATTVTNSNGRYSFDGACVQPNGAYQVRIDTTQRPLKGLYLTTANAGGVTNNNPISDTTDSDAISVTLTGTLVAVINATAPAAGINYGYDAGFVPVEIGDYVWKDSNADGLQDATEPGIAGVTVDLYTTANTAVQCVQDTTRYYLDTGGGATDSQGDLDWSGQPWTFSSAGLTGGGNPGNTVYIYGNGSATRAVDLAVFGANPVVSYDYAYVNSTANYSHTVEYSTNGGTTWTALATYTSASNTTWQQASFTLPTLSAQAQLRIRGVAGTTGNYLRIDNLRIEGGIATPATTVTDSNGHYSFDGAHCVQPNTTYRVRIDTQQTALRGLLLTARDAGGVTSNDPVADANDSDARSTTVNGVVYAQINTVAAPAAGVNYSYDIGFVPVEIGNFVWQDNNVNGLQDASEPGIPGVRLTLYDASNNAVQCVQDKTSYYLDMGGGATDSQGDLDWSVQPWTFTGAGTTTGGNAGNTVYVYGNGSATRAVDLSVFGVYPTLSYDYAYLNTTGGYNHVVEYSTNGGATWTTLATYSASSGAAWGQASFTLPTTNASTRIRIRGAAGTTGNYLRIDNLRIEGGVNSPASTVTDSNGHYTFDGRCIQPGNDYQVRMDTTQAVLTGLHLTTPNVNNPMSDASDSDATLALTDAVINFTAPTAGVNDSYDFGFVPVEIGDKVWKDSNANGSQDPGEPGLPGVTVGLYDASGTAMQCPQVGRYDTYRDGFAGGVSNGSTGSLNWGTSWSHTNTVVITTGGNPGGSLRLYSANNYYATRVVDLSAFANNPTLSFDYNFGGYAQSYSILYSSDGGTTFLPLTTLSDNNNTYKTITYTLPITAANAQIRIRGASGNQYAYFDNVEIRGQQRYPVTAVTDANGLYSFTGANCVQPSTTYQVRLDTTQAALFGLVLTTPNVGGVTNNDPVADNSDSDAARATVQGAPTAIITATAPAIGANDSYDAGFIPSPTGALRVDKTVNGGAAPAGWRFTLSSSNCTLPPSLMNPITTTTGAGGTVAFANLTVSNGAGFACQYQISEQSQSGWFLNYAASASLANLQVTANTTTTVQVINDPVQTCNVTNGNVGGTIFQDFDMDGQQKSATNEPPFTGGGIVVRAYGPNNQLLAQTSTQPDGTYVFTSLPNLAAGVRIEFQNLPSWLNPTAYTGGTPTGVPGARTSRGTVRFISAATCNVDLGVNEAVNYCQANPPMAVPTHYYFDPALGGNGTGFGSLRTFNYNASGSPTMVANHQQIGATWGEAYQRSTKTIFTAAFTRQFVNYGPLGRGGIYAINLSNPASPQVTSFVDLQTLGVNAGGTGPRPSSVTAEVGKNSLGDIDISEDGKTLYIMNLEQRELVLLDIASKTVTQKVPVPDPGCLNSSTTPPTPAPQDRRPWAIEVYHGEVYVGLVCSAETSQRSNDLRGYIMRLQGNQFVPFYNFPMTASQVGWQPWGTTLAPLFADFDFDESGSLSVVLLNLMDFKRAPSNPAAADYVANGDIFKIANVNGQLAATPTLYYQNGGLHNGATIGGSALKPGSGEFVSSLVDATGQWNTNGVTWYDSNTGQIKRELTIPQGFNKGSGLGDLELLCDPAPLEIGNRVWNDSTNPNGIQDPSEPGIPGVVVNLYTITGTVIATTTTDANGEYYFNNSNVPGGLKQNTDYTIRINRTQTPLSGFTPTLLNQVVNNAADPDEHDSDGDPTPHPGYVTTSVHTGSAGQNNYSYDFGFRFGVQIGNRLWIESDSDGDATTGVVTPVAGQVVTAISSSGKVYTATTDVRGFYTITVLANDVYTVTTGVPVGTTPSTVITTTATDANATANDNKNHLYTGTRVTVGTQNNYSIDFGFHAPLAQFGDRVWLESDADGLANTGTIMPIAGIVITATNGTKVYTTVTTAQGYYSFTVPVGTYTVTYGSVPSSYGVVTPSATPGGNSETGNAGVYAESSNPDRSHANNTTVTLTDGQANWHVDFAFWRPNPGIAIAKFTNGHRATGANDSDVPQVAPGAVVTWTYVVTNTGGTPLPLNVITVTDSVVGKLLVAGALQALSAPYSGASYADNSQVLDGVLGVGEHFTLRVTWVAPDLSTKNPTTLTTDEWVNGCDNGSTTIDESRTTYENLATVVIPGHVMTDTSHFCNPTNPGIALAKFTNVRRATGANDNDVPQVAPGAVVTWTYLVTNTGDTPLALNVITVTDSVVGKLMVGGVLQTLSAPYGGVSYADNSQVLDGVLGVGEHFTLRVTWTAPDLSTKNPTTSTTDEWVNGCDNGSTTIDESRTTYENLATVVIPGHVVTDTSHFCNPTKPGIALAKFTNGNRATHANDNDVPQVAPGATVAWTYLVTNTGDTPLALNVITVTDSVVGKLLVGGVLQTLSTPYSGASYVDNSQVLDSVLGVGEHFTLRVTWTAPDLSTKNPTTSTTDEWVNGCDNGSTTIDESRTTYENLATVVIPGHVVTDTSHFCKPTNPGVKVAKFTNGQRATGANDNDVPQVAPGAVVTWTYLVTNTGDTPLAMNAITVTDSVVGKLMVAGSLQALSGSYSSATYADNSQVLDGVLGVGEHFTLRVTWVAPNLSTKNPATSTTDEWVKGCDNGSTTIDESRTTYENLATVIIPGRTVTDTSHFCNPTNPGVAIAKFTNGNRATHANDNDVPQVAPGATVTWTYVVTNTGDTPLALNAITVTDSVVGKLMVGGVRQTLSAPYGGVSYADNSQVLDGVLSVGKHFTLLVTWIAPDLSTKNPATSTTDEWVRGCDKGSTTTIDESRTTYENLATVIIPGHVVTDTSHLCNPSLLSLGNLVWYDNDNDGLVDASEKGIADVVVKLYQSGSTTPLATTKTDANGKYLFANLNEGAYVVEVIPPTYVNSRGATKYYISSSDANRPDANKPDNLDNDDNGLDDLANPGAVRSAVVILTAGAEPSNEFDQNQPINGVVDSTPPANSDFHVDFGLYQPGVIRTKTWSDSNLDGLIQNSEPALANAIVALFRANSTAMTRQTPTLAPATDIYGQLVPTQTTGSDGYAFFDNLPPGEYIFQVTPPAGYVLTKGGADPDDDNPNDSNGVLVNDVIQSLPLTLIPGTEPTTDGDGADGNQTVDFGFVPLTGIGDRVWIDTNNNGIQDNGEQGLGGVTIRLYNAEGALIATVVTDATGQYHFLNLTPGQYYLSLTLPTGYAFTSESLGGDGTIDSDVDPRTGRTPLFQVDSGQFNVTLDVGIVKQPTALDEADEPSAGQRIYLPWISR